jgi:prevent-host-death family protein
MDRFSVVKAKAHFSEVLAKVEAGREVLITRRGTPVARMSAVEQPKKPLDLSAIDAFRERLRPTRVLSSALIRSVRDARY